MKRDDSLLEDLHERYRTAVDEWAEIRREGNIDMRVLSGDAWAALDEPAAKQRKDASRPMLAPDEIGQYVNQVVNDVRANPRAIKFAPTGNGANDKGATFYENKTREIEYRSHATMHNTAAFENAVQRSYGFTRVSTKYVHSQLFDANRPPDASLFDQDIWIEGFPNPDMVLPDPFAQAPDLSDQTHAFVLEWLPVKEFQRKYRGAKTTSFTDALINASGASDWFSTDRKQVLTAEYWTKETIGTRKLYMLKPSRRSAANPNGQPVPVYADSLKIKPDSDLIDAERDIEIIGVTQHLTNGVEILKTTQWPGQYIPIAGCFGKMLYLDAGDGAKRQILSMVRLARDPFKLYMYIRSCQTELVGLTPKFPYFYYEGQLSPDMLVELAKSIHVPVAGIAVKAMLDSMPSPTPLGFPQRNPYDAQAILALDQLAEAARRAIQSAMGITPLPTPVQRENQKSGKALQQIEDSGQRGSFHFRDNYENMIRFQGVIIENLLDKVIDTTRDTAIRMPDGNAQMTRVNDPQDPQSITTKGDYHVTVSTGPDFSSEREAASDFVNTLLGSPMMEAVPPPLRLKIMALAIRLKNVGVYGDEMADLLDPPQQGADPKQAMQQMGMLKHQLQQATQLVQQMGEQIKTEQVKIQGQKDIKAMDIDFQRWKVQTEAEAKIVAAELEAKVDRMQLLLNEIQRIGVQQHDLGMASADAGHEMAMSQLDHQQALEQQDAQAQHTMTAQAQQASLQPAPDAGAGAGA